MSTKSPRKRGPKPRPAAERGSTVNTSVTAEVRDFLEKSGDGSASRGARLVLAKAAELAKIGRNILLETP